MITKNCIQCGTYFSVAEHRDKSAKYCSQNCHYNHGRVTCICEVCGKKFIRQKSEFGKCCSLSCAGKKGEKHYAGFNGVYKQIDDKGYYKVFEPYHPLAVGGRVREAHLIAYEKLGVILQKGEVLHHIDEDRTNNDPTNLMVMTRADHTRHHTLDRVRRGLVRERERNCYGQYI